MNVCLLVNVKRQNIFLNKGLTVGLTSNVSQTRMDDRSNEGTGSFEFDVKAATRNVLSFFWHPRWTKEAAFVLINQDYISQKVSLCICFVSHISLQDVKL